MEYITDIADAFLNKKRIRTQSYRGSLLVTTCSIENANISSSNKIIIAPISYTSSIKSIKVAALDSSIKSIKVATPDSPIININIGILGEDKKIISDKAFGENISIMSTTSWQELLAPAFSTETIYERLHATAESTFEEYKNNRYGLVYINVDPGNTPGNAEFDSLYFKLQYVDGAPSDAPLNSKTIDKASKIDDGVI